MSTLAANDELPPDAAAGTPEDRTVFSILLAISSAHFLNDFLQSVLPALYPLFRESFALSFAQIGVITFVFHVMSSVFQPIVGYVTDRRPQAFLLVGGFIMVMLGLLLASAAGGYGTLLVAAGLLGGGSAIFHPEASRIAHLASGGRFGFAQSFFQLGGNAGTAFGPLLAVLVVRQPQIAWFALVPLVGLVIPFWVGHWYRGHLREVAARPRRKAAFAAHRLTRRQVIGALSILLALIFSKYIYITAMNSFYMFYLMENFGVSVKNAQLHLFAFAFCVALGTLVGGPVGDRYGRRLVIWISILGAAPFSLLLPHVGLAGVGLLAGLVGFVISSAFSAILVYGQALMPGKVGMVAGLFFGFAFGVAGIGSAVLGRIADSVGLNPVFLLCSFLPLIGLLTLFLPDIEGRREK